MSFNEILGEMIVNTSLVESVQYYEKRKVILFEPQVSDSVVEILGIPSDSIVIKADNFPVPDRFFAGTKSERKRADYIIITQYKESFYSLFIEMKRGKKEEDYIINQLKGALCLYKYIQAIGNIFWEDPNFLRDHSLRFISLSKTSLSKKTTRPGRSSRANGWHDTPENMLKISGSRVIRFENLLSRP